MQEMGMILPVGVDESVENPIPIIRRVRKMGLLDLVVPSERGISDAVTDRKKPYIRKKAPDRTNVGYGYTIR